LKEDDTWSDEGTRYAVQLVSESVLWFTEEMQKLENVDELRERYGGNNVLEWYLFSRLEWRHWPN
jgi:hypothetical protein